MNRVLRAFIRLYPEDYRAFFGAAMRQSLEAALNERRGRLLRIAAVESFGLLAGAMREWIAKFSTDPAVRGRCLPDLRKMRPVGVPRSVWFSDGFRANY
jgi:hypothetical protein